MSSRDVPFVFNPVVAYVSKNDSFLTAKTVCDLVGRKGVVASLGHSLGPSAFDVSSSVLAYFGIPLIRADSDMAWTKQRTAQGTANGHSLNVYPSRDSLTQLLFDLVLKTDMDADNAAMIVFYYEESDILLWKKLMVKRNYRFLALCFPKRHVTFTGFGGRQEGFVQDSGFPSLGQQGSGFRLDVSKVIDYANLINTLPLHDQV